MENEFIPYEEALAFQELGFDEHCYGVYGRNNKHFHINDDRDTIIHEYPEFYIPTLLYQQAFKWFRKNGYDSFIKENYKQTMKIGYYFGIDKYKDVTHRSENFNTYDEANLKCLQKLIEIKNGRRNLKIFNS